MRKEELINTLTETIKDMDDNDKIALWNEYCDSVNDFDSRLGGHLISYRCIAYLRTDPLLRLAPPLERLTLPPPE